jgi:hypothetical protein
VTDSKTVVEDLAVWLGRIWDEEEEIALTAAGWDRSGRKRANGQWVRAGISSVEDDERRSVIYDDNDQVSGSVADHIVRHDPASVLARIAADKEILRLHSGDNDEACQSYAGNWIYEPCETLRLLASPYADREGFRSEWLVERQGVEQ